MKNIALHCWEYYITSQCIILVHWIVMFGCISSPWRAMECIALHWDRESIEMYCIVMLRSAYKLHSAILHSSALHSSVLLRYIAQCLAALNCSVWLRCITMESNWMVEFGSWAIIHSALQIVLHCDAMHCTLTHSVWLHYSSQAGSSLFWYLAITPTCPVIVFVYVLVFVFVFALHCSVLLHSIWLHCSRLLITLPVSGHLPNLPWAPSQLAPSPYQRPTFPLHYCYPTLPPFPLHKFPPCLLWGPLPS